MGDVVAIDRRRAPAAQAAALPPPHDLEAERATLSACLLDGTKHEDGTPTALELAIDALGADAAAAWYDPANGRVWQAITMLHRAGDPVDLTTANRWLCAQTWTPPQGVASWAEHLGQLADASPAIGNVVAHAEIVRDLAEDRALLEALQRRAAEARAVPGDRAAWRAEARAELGRLTAPRVKLEGRHIGAVVRDVRAAVQEAGTPRAGVSWGLPLVDGRFGLITRGRQHLIAGRSEMGKTAFAAQVAWSIAERGPDEAGVRDAVIVFSAEMPGPDFLHRSACSLANIDALRVEAGLADADELDRLAEWLDWLEKLPIVIDDKPVPPEEIAARVRAWQAALAAGKARDHRKELMPKCRVAAVIGDHLQDFAAHAPPIRGERDELKQIQRTARDWKHLVAKGCGVATILLSQLTRDVADPKGKRRWPVARDLFGGTPVESSADVAFAVHRPEVLGKHAAKWRGMAALVPLKGRFGGSRQVLPLAFERGKFDDKIPPHARGEAWTEDDDEP